MLSYMWHKLCHITDNQINITLGMYIYILMDILKYLKETYYIYFIRSLPEQLPEPKLNLK